MQTAIICAYSLKTCPNCQKYPTQNWLNYCGQKSCFPSCIVCDKYCRTTWCSKEFSCIECKNIFYCSNECRQTQLLDLGERNSSVDWHICLICYQKKSTRS